MRARRALAAPVIMLIVALAAVFTGAEASASSSRASSKPPRPTTGPPRGTAPGHGKLAIVGGEFDSNRLSVTIQCSQGGKITFSQTGAGSIASTPFTCNSRRATILLTLGTSLAQAAHSRAGVHLLVDVRSGGSHISVPITLRKTQAARAARAQGAKIVEDTWQDAHWPDATANAVSSGSGSGGVVTVGPAAYASLGVHTWGEQVWWRAWLWTQNQQTGATGWLVDPQGWHTYSPYPNGATTSGQGIINNGSGVTVLIGGTSAPGVSPTPATFSVKSGWYLWPVIESYSVSNGYATYSVLIDSATGNVGVQSPNWLIFG